MDLELHRADLLQTASTCALGTLVVLPPGENKNQKVVLGDQSGVVQCFSLKKGEVAMAFKTLPSAQKVTSVCLGRGAKQRDKVFVAAGNMVTGLTRKGREFFRFATRSTGPLRCLAVADRYVWALAHDFQAACWVDGAEAWAHDSADRILAAEVFPLGHAGWGLALACQDRSVRILAAQSGQSLCQLALSSAPTCIVDVNDSHDPQHRHPGARELLVGGEDGRVTQLLVEGASVVQGFTIPPLEADAFGGGPHAGRGAYMRSSSGTGANGSGGGAAAAAALAPVRAIHCGADYSQSGCADIVIARDDGSLEVWDVDPFGAPQRKFATQLKESILGLAGGYVTSASAPDILLQTFSGKVIAFAPRLLVPGAAADGTAAAAGAAAKPAAMAAGLQARVGRLQAELAELQGRVDRARAEYAVRSESLVAGAAATAVTDSLRLLPAEGCHCLVIECALPLFTVALQASVPIELLEAPSNVAILSHCPPDPAAGSATLATYRCQESTSRLVIKFRAREGAAGSLRAFPIPALPPKTCRVVAHALRPLCLHERLAAAQGRGALGDGRPCSQLTLTGSFAAGDVHGWVGAALPDLPPQLPSQPAAAQAAAGAAHEAAWRQCVSGTHLHASYQAGQAVFLSDSVTTLATLHEALMRAATGAGARVSSAFRLAPGALPHSLALLWPAVEAARRAARAAALIDVLQELRAQDGDVGSYLAPEYRALLDQGDQQGKARQQQHEAAWLHRGVAGDKGGGSGGGAGAEAASPAGPPPAQALQEACDAVRQLLRDWSRLTGGGSAGAGMRARVAELEGWLGRKPGAGGGMQDVLAVMMGSGLAAG